MPSLPSHFLQTHSCTLNLYIIQNTVKKARGWKCWDVMLRSNRMINFIFDILSFVMMFLSGIKQSKRSISNLIFYFYFTRLYFMSFIILFFILSWLRDDSLHVVKLKISYFVILHPIKHTFCWSIGSSL